MNSRDFRASRQLWGPCQYKRYFGDETESIVGGENENPIKPSFFLLAT